MTQIERIAAAAANITNWKAIPVSNPIRQSYPQRRRKVRCTQQKKAQA